MMVAHVRVTANHEDIEKLLQQLPVRDAPRATISAINRVLPSLRREWARAVLERYKSRSLRIKDITQVMLLDRAHKGDPAGTVRVFERGVSLARFIPRGRLRTMDRHRSKGGWKRPAATGRRRSRPNERTPRVSVSVLAGSVERTIKGAFVLASGSGFIILRPSARTGKLEKLWATSVYSQAQRVAQSEHLERHAMTRVEVELRSQIERLAATRARRKGKQKPVTGA